MRPTALALLFSLTLAVPTEAARRPTLDSQMERIVARYGGKVALAAKNLRTGETILRNADERVQTASVIKLAILVEVFFQVQEGRLRLEDRVAFRADDGVPGSGILRELTPGLELPLVDAVTLMIALSDNTATNLAMDKVGIENVNARLASLGLAQTKLFKKVFKPAAIPDEETKRFGLGVTTPRDMLRLLELIERRQIIDAAACEKMIAILKKQQDRDGILRLIAFGDASEGATPIEFAGKSGALDKVRNDVGLLYAKQGPYAFAIFCYDSPDQRWSPENRALLAVARLAKLIYDHFEGNVAKPAGVSKRRRTRR